jgi:hypothetical protein
MVFAVVGQARAENLITPEEEGRIFATMLKYWALRDTLDPAVNCAKPELLRQAHRHYFPLLLIKGGNMKDKEPTSPKPEDTRLAPTVQAESGDGAQTNGGGAGGPNVRHFRSRWPA